MKTHFSLTRLKYACVQKAVLPEQIHLGLMVVSCSQHHLVCKGQGLKAHIKYNSIDDMTDGSLITCSLLSADIIWDESEQTFYFNKVTELNLLSLPLAPPQIQDRTEVSLKWGLFIKTLRSFLEQKSLLEVRTPSLVVNSGMEPTLEPLSTNWNFGSRSATLRLPTSPELHLKKLLCHGYTDIYEVKSCFRNQELTKQHEPEFTMLEWYRAFADLQMIEDDLRGLIKLFSPGTVVEVTDFTTLFEKYFSFDLKPSCTYEELLPLAKKLNLDVTAAENFDDLFHMIGAFSIEPQLDKNKATIIYGFPASQAALAKVEASGFAGRFELYWKGLEIANAYNELQDPKAQRQRHLLDQSQRLEKGMTPLPLDESFLKSLEKGLPPSAGIAVGLDRLFMAVYDILSISESREFTIKDQLIE